MQKILVTGGAGFIGASFLKHLFYSNGGSSSGLEIRVFDLLTYAGRANIEDTNFRSLLSHFCFTHGDICDRDAVLKAMRGCDTVVHFAAESHVTRSETDPGIFDRTNVQGTRVLLESADYLGVERFIHVSTDEVYGDAADGQFFREGDKEFGDHQATSAYAKSKSRADDVAKGFMSLVPLNIVRPTNNFGHRQFPEKALPRFITRAVSRQTIPLWGEGRQVRDWLNAADTARAIDLVIRKAPPGQIYNVGAGHQPEITNCDLAYWLAGRMSKYKTRVEHQPDPREHHDFRYGVDTTKIRALGWRPSPDIWGQFDEVVEWYLQNRAWWVPLLEASESIYREVAR